MSCVALVPACLDVPASKVVVAHEFVTPRPCLLSLHVLRMAASDTVTHLCLPVGLCLCVLRIATTETSTAVLQRTSGSLIMPQATSLLSCPTRQDECSTHCYSLLWMIVLMAYGTAVGQEPIRRLGSSGDEPAGKTCCASCLSCLRRVQLHSGASTLPAPNRHPTMGHTENGSQSATSKDMRACLPLKSGD